MNSIISYICRDIPIHIIQLITAILPNHSISNVIRGALVSPFLGNCGKHFQLAKGVTILKPGNLHIGNNVYIAHYAWLNAVGGITVGDNNIIGPMSVISTSRHVRVEGSYTNSGSWRKITIGNGNWIASHVVITDGVTIGDGSLICAGAVVTADVLDNSMYGGVPAKKIKDLE